MRITLSAVLLALSLMPAACGDTTTQQPAATSTPIHTPEPISTPTPPPTATPTRIPTPTPTPASTPTPVPTSAPAPAASTAQGDADIIAEAVAAMQQAESFRAEVDAAFKVVQTEASFRMDEETFGTEFPIRFNGEFAPPDRAAGKLLVSLGIVALEIDIITIGEQAYIANPETGAWEQIPLIYTGLPNPYDLVLPPANSSRYTDVQVVKDETIGGTHARHISANLRANMLGSSYDNLFVEMWIGEDNLLRRLTMAGETEFDEQDSAGLSGSAFGAGDIGGKAEFTMTITYSDFNRPVSIEPPVP